MTRKVAENNDGAAERITGVAGQTPVRGSGDSFSSGKILYVCVNVCVCSCLCVCLCVFVCVCICVCV